MLEPIQQDRQKRSAYSNLNLHGFKGRSGSARDPQRPSSSGPRRVSQMDPDWWKAASHQDSIKYQVREGGGPGDPGRGGAHLHCNLPQEES